MPHRQSKLPESRHKASARGSKHVRATYATEGTPSMNRRKVRIGVFHYEGDGD
jgi:hypothetical protein